MLGSPMNFLLLRLVLCLPLLLSLSACFIDRVGGAFSKSPEELDQGATDETKKLIDQA
jgi:hypothetical protein